MIYKPLCHTHLPVGRFFCGFLVLHLTSPSMIVFGGGGGFCLSGGFLYLFIFFTKSSWEISTNKIDTWWFGKLNDYVTITTAYAEAFQKMLIAYKKYSEQSKYIVAVTSDRNWIKALLAQNLALQCGDQQWRLAFRNKGLICKTILALIGLQVRVLARTSTFLIVKLCVYIIFFSF